MLLLRPAPSATIVAGTFGSNVGYGDGTVATGMPGSAFGSINFTPTFFSSQGRTVYYVYTDSTYFYVWCDDYATGTAGKSVIMGAESYSFASVTSALIGSNVRYRWTKAATLVSGTSYAFKVE